MSLLQREKLRGRRVMLLDDLIPDDLMDHLFQDRVLTQDQLDEIRSHQTRRKQAERLLSIIPYCGEKAYDVFIKALRETGKDWIADDLEKFDPDDLEKFDPDTTQISENPRALVPVTGGDQAMGGGVGGSVTIQFGHNQSVTLPVAIHGLPQ